MGLHANFPVALAPGMGLNAFLLTPLYYYWVIRGNKL